MYLYPSLWLSTLTKEKIKEVIKEQLQGHQALHQEGV